MLKRSLLDTPAAETQAVDFDGICAHAVSLPEAVDLIARRASIRDLKNNALERGFRPLAQDGIRRILQGVTSIAEVSRVVDLSDRM